MDMANANVGGTGPWGLRINFSTTQKTILRLMAARKQVSDFLRTLSLITSSWKRMLLWYLCTLRLEDSAEPPTMWIWRMPPASALPPEISALARAAVQSHLGHALRSSGDAQTVRLHGTGRPLLLPGCSDGSRTHARRTCSEMSSFINSIPKQGCNKWSLSVHALDVQEPGAGGEGPGYPTSTSKYSAAYYFSYC